MLIDQLLRHLDNNYYLQPVRTTFPIFAPQPLTGSVDECQTIGIARGQLNPTKIDWR
jgi:hypothetical protein